jgi:hypothetical protein
VGGREDRAGRRAGKTIAAYGAVRNAVKSLSAQRQGRGPMNWSQGGPSSLAADGFEMTPLIIAAVPVAVAWIGAGVAVKQ